MATGAPKTDEHGNIGERMHGVNEKINELEPNQTINLGGNLGTVTVTSKEELPNGIVVLTVTNRRNNINDYYCKFT